MSNVEKLRGEIVIVLWLVNNGTPKEPVTPPDNGPGFNDREFGRACSIGDSPDESDRDNFPPVPKQWIRWVLNTGRKARYHDTGNSPNIKHSANHSLDFSSSQRHSEPARRPWDAKLMDLVLLRGHQPASVEWQVTDISLQSLFPTSAPEDLALWSFSKDLWEDILSGRPPRAKL